MQTSHIQRLLEIVRTARSASAGLTPLLKLCAGVHPEENWLRLEDVDPSSDVDQAREWLESQLADSSAPTRGLYLGLDTMNMDQGAGFNVELAATSRDASEGIDWAWHCEWYGDKHLVLGLYEMKKQYEAWSSDSAIATADYALFLGYGGLVLAEAFDGIRLDEPCSIVWGFHDGDLGLLGRASPAGFQRAALIE